MKLLALLLGLLALAGCDKLTGAADQKIADAEAIGFACRVAQKEPEACMKENEAYGPSSILDGWKSADKDIRGGKLDPKMSSEASPKKEGDAVAPEAEKPAGDKPEAKDEKAAELAKTTDASTKNDKSVPAKSDKPAKTPVKPDAHTESKPTEAKDKAQP